MTKKSLLFLGVGLLALLASGVSAQTYNSNSGGYNTGYGTVYGTFGLAMATQNMYNSMQMNIQRNIMRAAMIKKWGRAAVEKAEREARSGSSAKTAAANAPKIEYTPPPEPKNYGTFRPDATVNTARVIADALGTTPEEKKLYITIVNSTKAAFEAQAMKKGWNNNLAAAFTFFIVSNVTIYHNAEEPGDEAVDALFLAVSQSLDDVPEFGRMANRDKQSLYNTLIAFAGIPLATYVDGASKKDAGTMEVASKLSGEMLRLVLKIDPETIRFSNGALVVG